MIKMPLPPHVDVCPTLEETCWWRELPRKHQNSIYHNTQIHKAQPEKICPLASVHYGLLIIPIQWGQKVFSQPLIVQVLLLRMMRDVCNFHFRYTSTMRDKMRKQNHIYL